MSTEKVIFRTERDSIDGKENIVAVFPEDPANPGRVGCVAFRLAEWGAVFEPYCEMALDYYYRNTKIIHKGTELAARALHEIERYYSAKFTVREKLR